MSESEVPELLLGVSEVPPFPPPLVVPGSVVPVPLDVPPEPEVELEVPEVPAEDWPLVDAPLSDVPADDELGSVAVPETVPVLVEVASSVCEASVEAVPFAWLLASWSFDVSPVLVAMMGCVLGPMPSPAVARPTTAAAARTVTKATMTVMMIPRLRTWLE